MPTLCIQREAESERLLARMTTDEPSARFLAVVGASGSGKSILLTDGLIPALKRGVLSNSDQWLIAEILLGVQPLIDVRQIISKALNLPITPPHSNGISLSAFIDEVLPDRELVLVIDSFERILAVPEAQQGYFIDEMLRALFSDSSHLRVIVAIRSDFFDHFVTLGLGELLRKRCEFIRSPTPLEIEQAILGFTRQVDITIDQGLISALIADIHGRPGLLPLLDYTLATLIEHREASVITLAMYQATGGAPGILARQAAALYVQLDVQSQAATRQLFLRLVSPEMGRRRALQSEVLTIEGYQTVLKRVVERFSKEYLLIFDCNSANKEPVVEIAHEGLIRDWSVLAQWIESDREALPLLNRLADDAQEWHHREREAGLLASGTRLEQYQYLRTHSTLMLNSFEVAYLDDSLAEQEAHRTHDRARKDYTEGLEQRAIRQRRQLKVAFAIGLIILISVTVITLFLLEFSRPSVVANAPATIALDSTASNVEVFSAQDAAAKREESLRLAAEANNLLEDASGNAELAAILGIRSLQLGYTDQAYAALTKAIAKDYTRRLFVQTDMSLIREAAFAPNGNAILLTGSDTRLLDIATAKVLHQWVGSAASFSPDGKQIVIVVPGLIKIFAYNSDTELQTIPVSSLVDSIAFSGDGKQLLGIVANNTNNIVIWDAATGGMLHQFEVKIGPVNSAVFSPDGLQILIAGGNAAWLIDSQTGQVLQELRGHMADVVQAVFSPDGKEILTASDDKTARLWDAETGSQIRQFTGHTDRVESAAFSPDGSQILTTSGDKTARLWDAESGAQERVLTGHTAGVFCGVFSPDGTYVVTCSGDHTARLWDARVTTEFRVFVNPLTRMSSVAFSPDGKQFLTASQDLGATAYLWDIASGAILRRFAVPLGDILLAATYAPSGDLIALLASQTITIWNVRSGTLVKRLTAQGITPQAISFSPDGKYLLEAVDAKLVFFDVQTGTVLHTLAGPAGALISRAIYFSDGEKVAAGLVNGDVALWSIQQGAPIRTLKGHASTITGLAISSDSKFLFVSSADGVARLYDLVSGTEQRSYVGHIGEIKSIALSPDNGFALTAGEDKTVRLWNVSTGAELRQFLGHSSIVWSAVFSPNGEYILSASEDKTVRMWTTDYQEWIREACGHLNRDLTSEERLQYKIDASQPICAQFNTNPLTP